MEEVIGIESAPEPALQMSAISAMPTGEIRQIPLDLLRESPWNPRQYYPEAEMNELIESMKQAGFRAWLPLMVRPIVDADGCEAYEIGAGHRRSRAAREAGIGSIPCVVRDLTDEQFLDVLNFDNCGREDVHPLHEASGWRTWMEKTGKGVIDIAARIGQSKEYVYQRLKYSALIPAASEAFLDGRITDGHAILIARLQAPYQKKALKFCEPPQYDPGHRPSVRDLSAFIQRDVHLDLSHATFDLSDVTLLAGAGSCDSCPKRTKNSPDLILDAVSSGEIDECTDPGCFNQKLVNHIARIKTKCRAAGNDVIEVSSNWSKPKKGALSRNDYEVGELGKNGAKLAVVIDGMLAGELIAVRLNSSPRPVSGQATPVDAARREKESGELKIRVDRERSIRLAILDAIRGKILAAGKTIAKWEIADLIEFTLTNGEISSSGMVELCRLRGVSVAEAPVGYDDDSAVLAMEGALPGLSHEEIQCLAVELPMVGEFDYYAIARNDPAKRLLDVARSYGVDAARVRREIEKPGAAPAAKKVLAAKSPKGPAKKKAQAAQAKKAAPKRAVPKKAKPPGEKAKSSKAGK